MEVWQHISELVNTEKIKPIIKEEVYDNIEKIMDKIDEGLVGDRLEDLIYLRNETKKYKTNKYFSDIVSYCAALIVETLPSTERELLRALFNNGSVDIKTLLPLARTVLINGTGISALSILTIGIILFEAVMVDEEGKEEHGVFSFNGLFEEMYFKTITNRDDVRRTKELRSEIYYEYGKLLFQNRKNNQAKKELKTAMGWNPVDTYIILMYLAVLYQEDNMEEYIKEVKKAFNCAYKSEQISDCYYAFAVYFAKKDSFIAMLCCYKLSLKFNPQNQNALRKIEKLEEKFKKAGRSLSEALPEEEEIIMCSNVFGFPAHASENIIRFLEICINHYMYEDYDKEQAQYFENIMNDITKV